MSRSPKSYPWSTLLPEEILREQLMKTDYDSLLTLCVSEDPRFPPICNDSYFWDEKLEYELETRNMTPQEFFELSAENGWAKFVAMLLTKYEIKDHLKVIPNAVENNHWLIIKILANYIPNNVIKAKKDIAPIERGTNKSVDSRTDINRYLMRVRAKEIISKWEEKSKEIFEDAYIDALTYERIKIIEVLQSYVGTTALFYFFRNVSNDEIIAHIQSGFFQKLNIISGSILTHIYNGTLGQMESLTHSETRELVKTIPIWRILFFAIKYSEPESVKLLGNIVFPPDFPDKERYNIVSDSRYTDILMREFIGLRREKPDFIKAIKKSKFSP